MRRAIAILLVATLALTTTPALAAPVAVRHVETITHAVLTLRAMNGDVLAYGELVQAPPDRQRMTSRLVFRFKDGSIWDDRVTYTQQKVFRVVSYHHVERGPSFPEAIEASYDRDTGRYRAKVDDKADEGPLELPDDLHDGLTLVLLKNLPPGTVANGHTLAFRPKMHDLATGLRILRLAVETHLVTSHHLLPLMTDKPGGLLVEVTDGTAEYNASRYRISVF